MFPRAVRSAQTWHLQHARHGARPYAALTGEHQPSSMAPRRPSKKSSSRMWTAGSPASSSCEPSTATTCVPFATATTQADMDCSTAVTYHHVEHPHTRRHSHRLGQQGSHGYSTTVSLQTRRRTNHTTPRPSVQRQPQMEAACRPLANGQHHLRPMDPRPIWLRAPPVPWQGSRVGRVPGQQGEDRVLRLCKRHNDAGSG